jgi:membrane protein
LEQQLLTAAARTKQRLGRAWRLARALTTRSVGEFFEDGCPQRAAAISYYTLFAVFPLAILSVVAFGIVISRADARAQVIDFLLDNLPLQPGKGRADLEQLLAGVTRNTATLGVVGFAGLLFSSSGVMTAIRHALNVAFDRSDESRPPLSGKALDILLVVAAGLFALLSLGLTIALRFAAGVGDRTGGFAADVARVVLDLGELLPLVLAFAVFLFLYRVVPSGRVLLRDVWPGALVGAIGYELAKVGFGVYLQNFGNYSAIYGSLGAIVAFLFFVFIAANAFLLGAEFASEWPGVRDASSAELEGDPGPGWPTRIRRLFVRPD